MTLDELQQTACPVFRLLPSSRPEHIGSAVLLRIGDEVFLLTAAHVSDLPDEGQLLIPGRDSLMPVRGYFAHIPVPDGSTRDADKIDISYYRLLPEVVAQLHPSLGVLTREDVFLCDMLSHHDLYTFAGYPWRKTRVSGVTYETAFYTFTGGAMSSETYGTLGYDPFVHVLIRFQRKKSFSFQRQELGVAPLPEGISGGGVFAWPKDSAMRHEKPDLKLVGIAHTYHESSHCMAATRINTYVACIFRNMARQGNLEEETPPSATPFVPTVVWYREDEWDELLASFADRDKMHCSWQEWREAALKHMEAASLRGMAVLPVEVRMHELVEYCRKHKVPNTSHQRAEFASRKFASAYFAAEEPISDKGSPTTESNATSG